MRRHVGAVCSEREQRKRQSHSRNAVRVQARESETPAEWAKESAQARKPNVNSLAKARALSQKCVKSRGERTCAALVDRIEAEYFIYPPATHTHTRTHEHMRIRVRRQTKSAREKRAWKSNQNVMRKTRCESELKKIKIQSGEIKAIEINARSEWKINAERQKLTRHRYRYRHTHTETGCSHEHVCYTHTHRHTRTETRTGRTGRKAQTKWK